MSIEALWSAEFGAPDNQSPNSYQLGAGIVVFETDRVFGGDAQYYYVGDYTVASNVVRARVHITHYAGEPWSIFGQSHGHVIVFEGPYSPERMILQGHLEGQPARRMVVGLTRRAELP